MKKPKLAILALSCLLISLVYAESPPAPSPSSSCGPGGDNVERCMQFFNDTNNNITMNVNYAQSCIDHADRFNGPIPNDGTPFAANLASNGGCLGEVQIRFTNIDNNTLVGTANFDIEGDGGLGTASVWTPAINSVAPYRILTIDQNHGGNHFYEVDVEPN